MNNELILYFADISHKLEASCLFSSLLSFLGLFFMTIFHESSKVKTKILTWAIVSGLIFISIPSKETIYGFAANFIRKGEANDR